MIDELSSFKQIVRVFQQVPYMASKNLYRVIDYFLTMDEQKLEQFCTILKNAKANLIPCSLCFCWQERNSVCLFCTSEKRDKSIICVVETWQDVIVMEQTRGYSGCYHVLGGVISPLDGINPEDLTIASLHQRVNDQTKEIILATSQTPEGEATASYIANTLQEKKVYISCLARGIPVGSPLGNTDRLTVFKALSERRPFR